MLFVEYNSLTKTKYIFIITNDCHWLFGTKCLTEMFTLNKVFSWSGENKYGKNALIIFISL